MGGGSRRWAKAGIGRRRRTGGARRRRGSRREGSIERRPRDWANPKRLGAAAGTGGPGRRSEWSSSGRSDGGRQAASPAFLDRPLQTSRADRYIRHSATSVASKRSILRPAAQEQTGQLDAVVPRRPDRRVSAGAEVRIAADDEKLTAAGRERRHPGPPHARDRHEAQHDEVDQRNQELFKQAPRLLMGNPTGEVGAGRRHEGRHPRQGVGGRAGRRRR